MPKEILIYGNINQYSTSDFINSVNDIPEGEPLNVFVNTNGGDPEYGFGAVSKFNRFEGHKSVSVDGKAYSWGFFFCLYTENVECLDVSNFMVHRAAYPSWYEKDPEFFTEEIKNNLASVNKSLETAMRNKIDVAKFEEIKGVKIKDIFSIDNRIDVYLTAKEAKQIKLVNKINKITPKKQSEIDINLVSMAAKYEPNQVLIKEKNNLNNNNQIDKKMTIEELKVSHPGLYNQVFNAGAESGKEAALAAETDRVGALLAYVDVDPVAISAAIKEGKPLTATMMAELSRKMFSKQALTDTEDDSEEELDPKPASEAGKKSDSEIELDSLLNLDKK